MYQTIDAAAWTLLAPAEPGPGSHIIVLTYAQSGAERLSTLLAGHSSLACTAGTGVIPLCEQAASTWRTAEASGSTLSTLAAASIRAMAGSMISVIKSRTGRQRWCEISTAPAQSARTFLQIYPETQIVCFHRSCADFVHSAIRGLSWGLGGPAFATFAAAHPGNPVAAAAAYWHACTEPLLALERDQVGHCQRVRYEDLASHPAESDRIHAFLGLRKEADRGRADGDAYASRAGRGGDGARASGGTDGARASGGADGARPSRGAGGGWLSREAGGMVSNGTAPARRPRTPDTPDRDATILAGRIPSSLLEQINRLHMELGYPAIGHVPAPS